MYLFIVLNLAIAYLFSSEHRYLDYLITDPSLYAGVVCMVAAVIWRWLRRASAPLWYDLFASGSLMVWLPYWYPDFRDGSPVFLYIPLYFAFISALFTLVFIRKRETIEDETVAFLQWLSASGRFNPAIIAVLVAAGLFFKQHFLLYPVAITLWVMRYALACSLNE